MLDGIRCRRQNIMAASGEYEWLHIFCPADRDPQGEKKSTQAFAAANIPDQELA
jgi:hypothetical protein